MKQFKIYANPQGVYEAVKEGWSWPAFFFGFFWALVKRLWAVALGVFAFSFIVGFVSAAMGANGDALSGVIGLIMMIVFGVNGNNWRGNKLLSRGFDYKALVDAPNSENAVATYMKQVQGKQA